MLREGQDLPLTLVSGPAGYGKSCLVRAWLEVSGFSANWTVTPECEVYEHLFWHLFFPIWKPEREEWEEQPDE